MKYLCARCGMVEVEKEEELCELCKIEDPFFVKKSHINVMPEGEETKLKDNFGRKILINNLHTKNEEISIKTNEEESIYSPNEETEVKVYEKGTALSDLQEKDIKQEGLEVQENKSLCNGIVNNLNIDVEQVPIIYRWFRTLLLGVPFNIHSDITSFQVFQDYLGNKKNDQGYDATQVIIYGKVNNGIISNNNNIEVYGHINRKNFVLAKKIKNCATGVIINPTDVLPVWSVWGISLLILGIILACSIIFGMVGVIWSTIIIICFAKIPSPIKVVCVAVGVGVTIFRYLGGL